MKQLLLIVAFILVGCSSGSDKASGVRYGLGWSSGPAVTEVPQSPPESKITDQPETKKPESPEVDTKVVAKKPEYPKVILNNLLAEAAIRKATEKPTGELTKADLEKLTHLSLHNNQLTGVKGLEKLTQLTVLNLFNNQLTDVKGLEKLTQLKGLILGNNQLTEVPKGLEKLTKLKFLNLSDNKLTNVKDLENLTQLKELILGSNKLTDVKGLGKLTKLGTLVLSDNPDLTKAQVAELQKALPKCKILSHAKK